MRRSVFPPRTRRRAAVTVLATAAVAATCGGGGVPEPGPTAIVDPAAPTAPVAGDNAVTRADPTLPAAWVGELEQATNPLAEDEVAWAEQRGRMVASLAQPGHGRVEDRLLGPGGLDVDLAACPPNWKDTAGVDDDTIRIAVVTADGGDHAEFGDLATGMQLYFDHVNEQGGVDGRAIELAIYDDRYEPSRTAAVVNVLVERDEAPFYIATVGTPTTLAVHDRLDDACVPHPFVASDHPAWADPAGHPFTTGFQLSRSTEAILWGQWIKANLPGLVPVTVGALVIDNDFGHIYADAFRAWVDDNPDVVTELVAITHDPAVGDVGAEMAEVAEVRPDVFLAMTAGAACLSAITETSRSGLAAAAVARFAPSSCRDPATHLVPAGEAAHGLWLAGGATKSLTDPTYADEPFVAFANARIAAAGIDRNRHLVGVGFAQYGWAHVELLRVAAALPGGLTRSNVVLAARNLDLDHPMLMDGVDFATAGRSDGFPIEGTVYSRYDAETGSWLTHGPPVDVNGATPNCSFSTASLGCR